MTLAASQSHADTLTTLASFDGTNGANPARDLTLVGSTLYGTTSYSGIGSNGTAFTGDGTVFSIPVTGGAATILASFNGADGAIPYSSMTLSGSTFYGTTDAGGPYGTPQQMVLLMRVADCLLLRGGRAELARMAIEYWLTHSPEARQALSRIGYRPPSTNA